MISQIRTDTIHIEMHYILKWGRSMHLEICPLLLTVSADETHYDPFQDLHPLIMSWIPEYYQVLSRNKVRSFLKLERPNQEATVSTMSQQHAFQLHGLHQMRINALRVV